MREVANDAMRMLEALRARSGEWIECGRLAEIAQLDDPVADDIPTWVQALLDALREEGYTIMNISRHGHNYYRYVADERPQAHVPSG